MSASRSMRDTGMDKFEYHKRFIADRALTTLGQVRVLAALWDFSDRHGENIRPGRDRLTEKAGVGHSTVDTALPKLVVNGYLIVRNTGGRSKGGRGLATLYALGVPDHWPVEISAVTGLATDETTPTFGAVSLQETSPPHGGVTDKTPLSHEGNPPDPWKNPPDPRAKTPPQLRDPSDQDQTNHHHSSDPFAPAPEPHQSADLESDDELNLTRPAEPELWAGQQEEEASPPTQTEQAVQTTGAGRQAVRDYLAKSRSNQS